MNPLYTARRDISTALETARTIEHHYNRIAANHVGEMVLHKRKADDPHTQAMDDSLLEMGGELNVLIQALKRLVEDRYGETRSADNDLVMYAQSMMGK